MGVVIPAPLSVSDRVSPEAALSTVNRSLFNGKEEQTTGNLRFLDYGARMYDPEICRWMSPDPLAEKYYSVSPYAYVNNNPIRFIDPDGRRVDDFHFTKDLKLVSYVSNNNPDRVFIDTDDYIYSPFNNMIPVSVEVSMSDAEINKAIVDNGYDRVVKYEIAKVKQTTMHISEADGKTRNMSSKQEQQIIDRKHMYAKDPVSNPRKTVERLSTPVYNTMHYGIMTEETFYEKRTYDYNKQNNEAQSNIIRNLVNITLDFITNLFK